jgi:thymidylate kinase
VSKGSKPLVVEFFGIPGAGKTTLLNTARAVFQEEGLRAYSVVEAARPFAQRTFSGKVVSLISPAHYRKQLLWQVFYYASLLGRLRFRSRHKQLIRYVSKSQKLRPVEAATRERRVLYWFHHLIGYYEFLISHAQPGEVLIWDDGFVHRAVHLHASRVETPDLVQVRSYLDLIPQPDVVIVPCTPIEVCEERIVQRGIWEHFRNKSRAELRQYLTSANQVVSGTVDYLKTKGWLVIEVDNSRDDVAVTQEELQRKLMSTSLLNGKSLKS